MGVRIQALPVLPGQCPQFRIIGRNAPAPDTIRFAMDRCPRTEQDFAGIFDVGEVDDPPVGLRGPITDPENLAKSGKGGLVILHVVIDTSGLPEQGSLEVAKTTNSDLIPLARQTVLGSAFKPGRLLGRNVRTRIQVTFDWSESSPH
ncbi:MAG TPA: energy transducer TonB [bacterium]|nr:energy transducer TonB [bacterium]